MSEFYAERRRENRYTILWMLMAAWSAAWVLSGDGFGLLLGGVNVALAALERTRIYVTIPRWLSEVGGISFGDMMRGQGFDLRGYFRKIFLGFLPATVLSVAVVTACGLRNGRPAGYILAADAVLIVVPVVMHLLYYASLQYRFTHEKSVDQIIARGSEFIVFWFLQWVVLAVEALSVVRGNVPVGIRMALCWVDGRSETLYWWRTNPFDPIEGMYMLCAAVIVCVVILATEKVRNQILPVLVIIVIMVGTLVYMNAFSYAEMSLDRVTVHSGLFDREGTEFSLDGDVTDYVFAFEEQSGSPRWTIHLYFGNGRSFEANCAEVFRNEYFRNNEFRYTEKKDEAVKRFASGNSVCAASNRWLEQYETAFSYAEALSERLSSVGARGWIGFVDEAGIATLKPEEQEVCRRLVAKLPAWD